MVSELNYPLLNFEFVKSAKFFFFPLFYFGWMHSRQRGLAVSDPAYEYEGSVVRIPATTRKKHWIIFVFLARRRFLDISFRILLTV